MEWSEPVCIVNTSYRAVSSSVSSSSSSSGPSSDPSVSSSGSPETVIELFCRAKAGHSVTLLVHGLRPFLEIALPGLAAPDEDVTEMLASVVANSEVVSVGEAVEKWTENGVKRHWRVELTQPFAAPRVRRTLGEIWDVSSADIIFPQRLLLDSDLGPHIQFYATALWAGPRAPPELLAGLSDDSVEMPRLIAAEKIRDAGGAGLYPTDVIAMCTVADLAAIQPFAAPFVTLSFDLETSVKHDHILCAAVVIERAGQEAGKPGLPAAREVHALQGEEAELLANLTRLVRESDPDIITGWNIDNFDLPRIDMRQRALAPKNDFWCAAELFGWGRVPLVNGGEKRTLPERQQNRRWRMAGRCVMDAWWEARMTLRPRRESLKFVSELLFPDREELRKLDIDASRMDEEWAARPDEVLHYCVQDTVLPLEILTEMQTMMRKEALAVVAKVPLDTAIGGTTSQWIDSLVIRLADREGIAIPRTKGGARRDQIAGGYVHEVEPGIHPWVAVLDFKSMYPSIMISNNICSTTRVDTAPDGIKTHESPIGTHFLPSTERSGLVPRLLQDLMSQRDQQKELMIQSSSSGDDTGAVFHDRLQYALKILMNSFYGVFASSFYRFTHPDLGASITAWARSNIKAIIQTLEDEGHPVVYSDTDSIFVSTPVSEDAPFSKPTDNNQQFEHGSEPKPAFSVTHEQPEPASANHTDSGAVTESHSVTAAGEQSEPEDYQTALDGYNAARESMIKFGRGLAERFSVKGAELEFETGLSAFFSHGAKKRYVGRMVWPEEKLLVRGYEVRRTDSFNLLTKVMMETFNRILDGEQETAVRSVLDLIAKIRNRDVEPLDLVISRSCKGHIDRNGNADFTKAYDYPDRLPYVRAAKKRIQAGLAFTPGMKIGWLVIDRTTSPMVVAPWLVEETGIPQDEYDAEFYAKRVAIAMGRITEAFGWTADDLLKGNRQTTLFSF